MLGVALLFPICGIGFFVYGALVARDAGPDQVRAYPTQAAGAIDDTGEGPFDFNQAIQEATCVSNKMGILEYSKEQRWADRQCTVEGILEAQNSNGVRLNVQCPFGAISMAVFTLKEPNLIRGETYKFLGTYKYWSIGLSDAVLIENEQKRNHKKAEDAADEQGILYLNEIATSQSIIWASQRDLTKHAKREGWHGRTCTIMGHATRNNRKAGEWLSFHTRSSGWCKVRLVASNPDWRSVINYIPGDYVKFIGRLVIAENDDPPLQLIDATIVAEKQE